jgi:methylation protein MtfA
MGTSVVLPPAGTIRRLADTLDGSAVIGDIYDIGAPTYESLVDEEDNEVPAILVRTRGLRGDVLDLGCGGGHLTLPLLARGHRVVAVDRSPAMLAQLAARAARLPRRLSDNLRPYQCDMSAVSLPGRRFDIVVLGTTTVTLLDAAARARTFRAVRRHLAPGGRFLVSTLWFDRTPEQGPVPEKATVVPVTGSGGITVITILEQVAADLSHRWVGVLDTGPVGEPLRPSLFLTRPGILAEAALRGELTAAGLRVLHCDPLTVGAEGRRVTLLTCEANEETP